VTKTPVKLSDLFRYYKHGTPHQMAAIVELEAALLKVAPDALNRDQPWFKTWSQAGKQPEPIWLAPTRKIVAEFEGCRLQSYLCSAGVPTIGYGRTGPNVKLGQTITQQQADDWLAEDLHRFAAGIHRLLPGSNHWGANQQAALISWAFNVGLGAVETSTLRKRLIAGEPGIIVIPQELPKWDKAAGKPSAGLARRRAAEVASFKGPPPLPMQQSGIRLQVPYELQHDNKSGAGYRECFSSSAAMVAKFYKKVGSDDAYNQIRSKYGDTTDVNAQVKALASLGIKAQFRKNGNVALLESELRAGRPVMVGWLHQGPLAKPTGTGHWSVIIGYNAEAFIHNDPNGQANLTNGGYINKTKGAGIAYPRKSWLPRWLLEGPNSGWCMTFG
jgi:GH24 family phage-related lysozyme (muramidase)